MSTVKAIVAGGDHTCALLSDKSLKCWGLNSFGQLGLGHKKNHNTPQRVKFGSNVTVKAVTAGANHTCAILNDNTVKCWGEGAGIQHGSGSDTNPSTPQPVSLGDNAIPKVITAGGFHTCVILNDSSVRCWGSNHFGQLGLGHKIHQTIPQPVNLGPNVTAKSLAGGAIHTCALLSDGRVKCWGSKEDKHSTTPQPVNLGTNVTAKFLAGGTYHTCALLSNHKVKCWKLW